MEGAKTSSAVNSEKEPKSEEKTAADGFWTAAKRQYLVIALVNMVTFLFGASQPTASISVPRLMTNGNSSRGFNDTTWGWAKDFPLTLDDGEWISERSGMPLLKPLICVPCSPSLVNIPCCVWPGIKLHCGDFGQKEVPNN